MQLIVINRFDRTQIYQRSKIALDKFHFEGMFVACSV